MNKLLENWEIIRDECLVQVREGIVNDFIRPKNMDVVDANFNGWVKGWTGDNKWLNYGLVYNCKLLNSNCTKCPKTSELVKKLMEKEKVIMVGYSWLKPKSGIPKHTDETSSGNYIVYHIGLSIPNPEKCLLWVDGTIIKHREGELIYFDDKKSHWAINNTVHDRLVLYIKCLIS